MEVNRRRALLLVTAIAACHAEPSHDPSATAPKRDDDFGPAPSPPASAEPLSLSLAPATSAAAVSDSVDGGTDGGSALPNPPPPKAPLPSTSELLRRCRDLPKRGDCDELDPRAMCRTAVNQFSREAAARAVSCYEKVDEECRGCAIKTCTQEALTGFARRGLPACESVRKKVSQASDAAYGATMFELCEDYAAGMNQQGVRRFSDCLKRNIGIGVRFCLWDPSVTPCTEGNGSEPRRPALDVE